MMNQFNKSKDKWIGMSVDKEIIQQIDKLLADNPSVLYRDIAIGMALSKL